MPNAGIYSLYRREAAALRGMPELDREIFGLDLGQSSDPAAVAVVRRVELPAGVVMPEEAEPEPVPEAEPAQKIYAKGSQQWLDQQTEATLRAFYAEREG